MADVEPDQTIDQETEGNLAFQFHGYTSLTETETQPFKAGGATLCRWGHSPQDDATVCIVMG